MDVQYALLIAPMRVEIHKIAQLVTVIVKKTFLVMMDCVLHVQQDILGKQVTYQTVQHVHARHVTQTITETVHHASNALDIVTTPLGMLATVPIALVNVMRIIMVTSVSAHHVLPIAPTPLVIHMAAKLVRAHVMRIITV